MYARMRSPNYKDLPAPIVNTGAFGTIENGGLLLVESTWGMAFNAKYATGDLIPIGETVVLFYNCDKIMVHKSHGQGAAWTAGQKAYVRPLFMDVYGANVKADPTHVCIGTILENADAFAVLGMIDLEGNTMTDQA